RPLACKLERALVRFRARITEEGLAGERLRELGRESLTGLGAIEVRDMDQSRVQRAQDRFADDGAVGAQGVDRDARHETGGARAVLGDELATGRAACREGGGARE